MPASHEFFRNKKVPLYVNMYYVGVGALRQKEIMGKGLGTFEIQLWKNNILWFKYFK